MNLRTRILLFLFGFALLPLAAAVAINLPLVLDRAELFYRHAYLQNLRADFRDLDQHLASRQEMLALLAKLPEPGAVMGDVAEEDTAKIDLARARYTEWINRIMDEQIDVREIVFMDEQGIPRFWLERSGEDRHWQPTVVPPEPLPLNVLSGLLALQHAVPIVSPIRFDPDAQDPSRALTVQMISPLKPREEEAAIGAVYFTLDMTGLVRRDKNSHWARQDGSYLVLPGEPEPQSDAFEDFPGLNRLFAEKKADLWQGEGEHQVIWVPLLQTENQQPLWVGRQVDRRPLEDFQTEISIRVVGIILALLILIWLLARWFAKQAEKFGSDLFDGLQNTLEHDQPYRFSWRMAPELERLSGQLSQLTETHVCNSRNLRAHARELEASNRYKSEFLANVSHELRTPLNSILLLSRLLHEPGNGLTQEQLDQVDVIHKAGADLKALIDNILDLSRIEAGRLEVFSEEVVIDDMVDDLFALLEPQFRDKGLVLEQRRAPDAPASLHTDADKLRQILKNFLSNALKFTARGRVRLLVGRANPPHALCFTVQDSGIGISADKQEVIFEAFQQADGSTRRRYGGTGLGLTISRELAELLGGEIRVDSEPGSGSAFTLLLPAEPPEVSAVPPPRPKAAAVAELPEPEAPRPVAKFAGERVLIVDADMSNLLNLTPLLEEWNLHVSAAADADEAIETLSEESDCRLVLIDPYLAGLDACATIQTMREIADLRFIAMLPADHPNPELDCQAHGADVWIAKPVECQALLDAVRTQLQGDSAT